MVGSPQLDSELQRSILLFLKAKLTQCRPKDLTYLLKLLVSLEENSSELTVETVVARIKDSIEEFTFDQVVIVMSTLEDSGILGQEDFLLFFNTLAAKRNNRTNAPVVLLLLKVWETRTEKVGALILPLLQLCKDIIPKMKPQQLVLFCWSLAKIWKQWDLDEEQDQVSIDLQAILREVT